MALPSEGADSDDFLYLFNPDFAGSLTVEEIAFIQAHETMHILLGHLDLHKEFENPKAFNVAADIVINDLLVNEGLTPPAGACLGPVLLGYDCSALTVHEVYDALLAKYQSQQDPNTCSKCGKPKSKHGQQGGDEGQGGDVGQDGDQSQDDHQHADGSPCGCKGECQKDESGESGDGEGQDGENQDGESGDGQDGESDDGQDGESGDGQDGESGDGQDGESGDGHNHHPDGSPCSCDGGCGEGDSQGGEGDGQGEGQCEGQGEGEGQGDTCDGGCDGQGDFGGAVAGGEEGSIDDHRWIWEATDEQAEQAQRIYEDTDANTDVPEDVKDARGEGTDPYAKLAGIGVGAERTFQEQHGVTMKWTELLKRVDPDIFKPKGPKQAADFSRSPRKIGHMAGKLALPVYREPDKKKGGELPRIVMALDTSGSVQQSDVDMFLTLARSIPKNRVELICCSFTSEYMALDLDDPRTQSGGTDFSAIERFIRNEVLELNKGQYPKAVVVISDGYAQFNREQPDAEQLKGWHWLLCHGHTPDDFERMMPDCGSYDDLDEYVNL